MKRIFAFITNLLTFIPGADLLKLTRDDVIQICGPADGIRLFNALKGRYVITVKISMRLNK
jgi:transcription factor CP2-like protein